MAAINTKNALVPKLRFKGFDDLLQNKKLGDIAEFQKGKGISKSDVIEDGKLECIRYGELYTYYNETIKDIISKTDLPPEDLFLSQYNDVIIPASGETQIDIATASCVLKSGVALSGDLNIIRSPINGVFLSFYLNSVKKFDIARLAQGSSVMHLYSGQLKSLRLNLPTLPEQQKIASFLSAVDDKIRQLTRKKELLEQYKKGVMQQLFSGKLRFKDDKGKAFPEWEEKRLGDVCEFYRGGPLSKSDLIKDGNYLCIHYGELFTIYNEIINHVKSKTNLENGFLSLKGDILMPSSDVTPLGLAKASSIQLNNVVLGGDMNILRPKNNYDSIFFSYLLNHNQRKIIQLVTGTTVKHIYNKDVKLLNFKIPKHLNEQQKIATYLSSIDSKLERVSGQIEQTQTFKKGLLQQMFV